MTQASTSNLNLTLMRIVFDDCSDGRSWRRIPKRSSEEVESARGGGVGRGPSWQGMGLRFFLLGAVGAIYRLVQLLAVVPRNPKGPT